MSLIEILLLAILLAIVVWPAVFFRVVMRQLRGPFGNVDALTNSKLAKAMSPPKLETRGAVLAITTQKFVKLANGARMSVRDSETMDPEWENVPPNKVVEIIVRPQAAAFRGERVKIENPERWMIHDVKIGNRSQFSQSLAIPAEALVGMDFTTDTAQTAMDVSMSVSYIGASPDGEPFRGALIGREVFYPMSSSYPELFS